MRTINLTIEKQTLTLDSLESLPVQGSDNSVKLAFAFDDSWNNYPTRRAYFQYHFSNWKYVELSNDNEVLVPREFLAKPGFKVMIRGYAQSGAIMATNIENVPVEFAPSLADSTAVVPVAIRSGDDAISVEQEGDIVTISLNDEFESNKFVSDYTIRGTAQGEIIFLDGVLLGTTEKSFADFKSIYNQIVIPYEFTIGSTTYHDTLVATETRYNAQNAYYVADLLPLGQNYTAIVTIYLDENSVKAVVACLPFTLNNSFDNAPTSGSTKLVNSGAVYSAIESAKALLEAYSDANLATAKSYADGLLVEGKQYTDTKYNSLVGIITHETEVMEARITSAITQMQNQVNASITGMETTIQGELTALDQRVDEAISTMNTTITTSLTNMENTIQQELANFDTRFSTLQTALEARITTLSNQIDSQFSTLQTQLEGRIDTLEGEVDTKLAELEDYQEELDSKITFGSNWFDGSGGVSYADNADNLIATKGLTINDDPMSFGIVGGAQKSSVGDGNATLNKLVCVDVVKNQLIKNPTFTSSQYWDVNNATFTDLSNNTCSFVATAQDGCIFQQGDVAKTNHIFYTSVKIKLTTATDKVRLYGYRLGLAKTAIATTEWQTVSGISTAIQDGGNVQVTDGRESDWDVVKVKEFISVDLTKRYGSNEVVNAIIGSDTSTQVAKLLAFDPEILENIDHDTGTLVPSKTAKLLSVGVNQWDEVLEQGSINNNTGEPISSSQQYRSKNFIPVLPSASYYKWTNTSYIYVFLYDANKNFISRYESSTEGMFETPSNCYFIKFRTGNLADVDEFKATISKSDPNINGKYYPSKRNSIALPNYEGHGILKVENGKVVANGTELYPDGNSKKRYDNKTFVGSNNEGWTLYNESKNIYRTTVILNLVKKPSSSSAAVNALCDKLTVLPYYGNTGLASDSVTTPCMAVDADGFLYFRNVSSSVVDLSTFLSWLSTNNVTIDYELATEEEITTPVYQSNFPVEQGGTLQFLDENDNPIAGLQGNEIFYQKNIKAFVEAFGEAIDWNPERIERLANLSFTPEYVNISLNPTQANAYAKVQVMSSAFTIVISTALTGTPNGEITFQDSEIDLSGFETKPAELLYDMDNKKVSEAPTTTDCNIASFVGRSYNGIVLWSLLHSGVNKVKVHFEQAIPLDSEGKGKLDCRANMIL